MTRILLKNIILPQAVSPPVPKTTCGALASLDVLREGERPAGREPRPEQGHRDGVSEAKDLKHRKSETHPLRFFFASLEVLRDATLLTPFGVRARMLRDRSRRTLPRTLRFLGTA